MSNRVRHKIFKVSINVPLFYRCIDSRVYEQRGTFSLLLPIFIHSLGTIVLGFWGHRIFASFSALHINFSGGEDVTDETGQNQYDKLTTTVWNNLSRKTAEKLDIGIVQMLIELQEKYIDNYKDSFSENNVYFLLNELNIKGKDKIFKEDIEDFFDSLNTVFGKG